MDWNTVGIMFWNNLLLMAVIVVGILAVAFVAASIWVMIEERRKSPEAEDQEHRLKEFYYASDGDIEPQLADVPEHEVEALKSMAGSIAPVSKPKRRGGRPKGSKNKAKVAIH